MLGDQGARRGHLTLVLVALATCTVALATADQQAPLAWPLFEALAWIAVALVLRVCRVGNRHWFEGRDARVMRLVLFIVWPLVIYLVGGTFGVGLPLESLLLRTLQATAIGLIAEPKVSARRDVLAVGTSAFAVVFSASMAPTELVRPLATAFAGFGMAWLIVHSSPAHHPALLVVDKRARWGALFAVVLAAACLITTALFARPQYLAARWGWLASSGGTDTFDPFARNGVGDGDALVRAEKDASSVGPVAETDVFLAADTPSLYDMFNDMYGDPPRPKNAERAVPLPADLTPRDEQQVATAKQAGREFSAVREAPERRNVKDSESRAVLHLVGRAPAHLRVTAFDIFDGRTWYPAEKPSHAPPLSMDPQGGLPWLDLQRPQATSNAHSFERHTLKILSFDTAHIPLAAETTHLAIDQVEAADFFEWRQEGVVGLQGRRTIPPLTVVELVSDVTRTASPGISPYNTSAVEAPRRERSLPPSCSRTGLERLARQWTADCHTPAEQVAAIVRRLREEYTHDRAAVVAEDSRDAVSDFLFRARRGPDYLFASSAAVLMRTLGYRTRVVSGFYASPTRYDRRSASTPVLPEDVHFWAEVRGTNGEWISVEPTPGYELLSARMSWAQWCQSVGGRLLSAAQQSWQMIAVCLAMGIVAFMARFRLADAASGVVWRVAVRRSPESAPYLTWRVLDWRARRVGLPRASGATVKQWFHQLPTPEGCSPESLTHFLSEVSRSVYGPPASYDSQPSRLDSPAIRFWSCREIIDAYKISRLRIVTRKKSWWPAPRDWFHVTRGKKEDVLE